MKIRSSGIGVFFIQKPTGFVSGNTNSMPWSSSMLCAKHQPGGALALVVGDLDGEGAFAGGGLGDQRRRVDRQAHRLVR